MLFLSLFPSCNLYVYSHMYEDPCPAFMSLPRSRDSRASIPAASGVLHILTLRSIVPCILSYRLIQWSTGRTVC